MPGVPSLAYVPQADIDEWWPRIEPILRRAIDRVESDLSLSELYQRAKAGNILLWVAIDDGILTAAMATTEIVINGERTAFILAMSGIGEGKWIEPLLAELERLALLTGIKRIRLSGRKGWARALPDYRIASIVLEKILNE